MSIDTITAAVAALCSDATTAVALVEASLQAVERHSLRTNAFIRVDADAARAAAREADAERARGTDRGPLHGIPISLKDLIDVAGQPTTAASRVLETAAASKDAPVVTRLREAGAIVIGKTNLHEFALGTTSEDSAFGAVRHPRDGARSPGGSSGGSAAAVATGMGLGSIGTDTGGSIRIPAAACGIVGLKPSFGEISTEGVFPLSASLDHVGPLTRTVQDAAWLWAAMTGASLDRLTATELASLRFGRLGGHFAMASGDVRAAFESAMNDLRRAGATSTDKVLPDAPVITRAYVNVVLPEAAAGHAAYLDSRSVSYTPDVRARLEGGRAVSAVEYLQAQAARRALRDLVDAALADCDALVLPTMPCVAPLIGERDVDAGGDSGARLNTRAAMLRNTQLFNMTGHPAISIPLRAAGLPVGLQLVGARDRTARLLSIAAAVEQRVAPAV